MKQKQQINAKARRVATLEKRIARLRAELAIVLNEAVRNGKLKNRFG